MWYLVLFDQLKEELFLSERTLPSGTSLVRSRRADLAGAWEPRGGGWDAGTLESSADAVRAMPNLHDGLFGVLAALSCTRVSRIRYDVLGGRCIYLWLFDTPRVFSAAARSANTKIHS